MAPAHRPQAREDQRPICAQIEEGEKREKTPSLACGKSRAWTGHTASKLGARGEGASMQGHDCKAAFFLRGNQCQPRFPAEPSPRVCLQFACHRQG